MATYTDNYKLTKPTYAEQADIGVINSNMNIIDDIMHSSQVSLAPAYDSTKSYAEGDKVMYELLMYKCISPTTGVWDGSKWERTTAAETGGEASDLSVKVPEVISTGDKACYVKRAIPTAGALAEGQKIVGATLAWNQEGDYTGIPSSTVDGIIVTNNNDGSFTLSGQANGSAIIKVSDDFDIASGHVYINFGCPSGGASNTYRIDSRFTDGSQSGQVMDVNALDTGSGDIGKITTVGTSTKGALYIRIENGYTINKTFKPQYVDLTQLFGSTIADAIYQMEQTTAGSGVAFFRKYFPEDYYAYESGKLESVNVSEHKAVGFNQWDEEYVTGAINDSTGEQVGGNRLCSKNYISVIPNTEYYINLPDSLTNDIKLYYYDGSLNFISPTNWLSEGIVTIPNGATYMKFNLGAVYGQTYNNDVCINISKTAGNPKNGDYVPYDSSSITLDNSKEFRGLYKLINGELQADGDVYEADGTVTRKFNISTYNGSENWTVHSSDRFYLNVLPSDMTTNYAYKVKSITNYCEWLDDGSVYGNYFSIGGSGIYVNKISNNETLAEFQTRLSNNNLTLLYYINTPTTETATPYTNPQIVDADGTEEFVDYKVSQGTRDVAIPVGHESSFYDYTDGSITIPDLPFADGIYALSVTMNNGTPTFSWEGGN